MKLKIDPRLCQLLPELTPDELAALRESITTDGCREPLTVWNGYIVDGHNRYAICQELGIAFKVREVEFTDEAAAMD